MGRFKPFYRTIKKRKRKEDEEKMYRRLVITRIMASIVITVVGNLITSSSETPTNLARSVLDSFSNHNNLPPVDQLLSENNRQNEYENGWPIKDSENLWAFKVFYPEFPSMQEGNTLLDKILSKQYKISPIISKEVAKRPHAFHWG